MLLGRLLMVTTRSHAAKSRMDQLPSTTRPSIPLVVMLLVAVAVVALALRGADLGFDTFSAGLLCSSGQPHMISDAGLAFVRGTCAVIIWCSIAKRLNLLPFLGSEPQETVTPLYFPQSRLPRGASITLSGFNIFSTFTVQCWTLQGLYFAGTFALWALDDPAQDADGKGRLRHIAACVLWVLFEISFTVAPLVSGVVRYILIPTFLKNGEVPRMFFKSTVQLMHNANLLFIITEALLNRAAMIHAHYLFIISFGLLYVMFAWCWLHATGIVYYAFIDPTLPPRIACPIHIGLIVVLAGLHSIGVFATVTTAHLPLGVRAILLYGFASLLCWTSLFTGVPQPQPQRTGK